MEENFSCKALGGEMRHFIKIQFLSSFYKEFKVAGLFIFKKKQKLYFSDTQKKRNARFKI